MVRQIKHSDLCVELFKRGNYTVQTNTPWGIHKKQEQALRLLCDPKVNIVGYGGSARSGKSWIASEYLTMMCLAYPDTGWGLARKELKTLKRTTLLTLFKVFKKYKLVLGDDFKYNQQDQIIRFKNGSEIFLIDTAYQPSDPMFTRFGGYELTGVVIDESNETIYEAIDILHSRCGFRHNLKYGISPKMLEMFNPDKGHVYERFYTPYKTGTETEDKKFIPALPADNPDPAVKAWISVQIANATKTTIERLVNGNFDYDDSSDRLLDNDAINDYFTNEHVKGTGVLYITADIARMGKDKTVIRVWDGYKVILRKELHHTKVTETAQTIRDIANEYKVGMSRTIVDEDGVGGGVRDILRCHGYIANSSPFYGNYSNLKSQCSFMIAQLINERAIHEICEDLLLMIKIKQELDWLREKGIDKDQKRAIISKDDIKQAIRRSPDDLDCITMRAWFALGHKV